MHTEQETQRRCEEHLPSDTQVDAAEVTPKALQQAITDRLKKQTGFATKEIEVTVQGMANTLQSLKPTDIHVTVDLSDAAASHLTSKRVEISVPAGVSHVRVFPAEVHIMFPSGR